MQVYIAYLFYSTGLHSPSTGVGNDASIVFHARVLMGSPGVLLRLKSVKQFILYGLQGLAKIGGGCRGRKGSVGVGVSRG